MDKVRSFFCWVLFKSNSMLYPGPSFLGPNILWTTFWNQKEPVKGNEYYIWFKFKILADIPNSAIRFKFKSAETRFQVLHVYQTLELKRLSFKDLGILSYIIFIENRKFHLSRGTLWVLFTNYNNIYLIKKLNAIPAPEKQRYLNKIKITF